MMPKRSKSHRPSTLFLAVLIVSLAATEQAARPPEGSERSAWDFIQPEELLAHIQVLASDEYEGRAPASRGEELTIDYLESQFKQLGLRPGHPDGTYRQKVPLVGISPDLEARLVFTHTASQEKLTLKYAADFVARPPSAVPQTSVDAEMVFVGYGVVAPEFEWDDYKGVDVKGKVLVMLINDPPVPDERVFGGKAMTYYGRWTYKYEIAAQKGAAGCLIIHETEPAAYPWDVPRGSGTVEQFDLPAAGSAPARDAFNGWITLEKAQALFAMAGKDFAGLKKAAVDRNFAPVSLGVRASLTLKNKIRRIESHNVIAKLEGSDPKRRDEYVVYMAHWDHMGVGQPVDGDSIYNGARDNASGTAGLLELAEAFSKVQPAPRRSILFLAVTAEEKGLLGSQYYAERPLYPLAKTVAVLNMDGLNVFGRTSDVVVIGLGFSTLDDHVKAIAAEQSRSVKPDAEPEKGYYYRSDHFNFAKQGVPALYTSGGVDYLGKPAGWGMEMRKKYTAEDYHKPSDEIKPDWELSGAADDLRLLFSVGYRVANADAVPAWNPGTEFRAKQLELLKTASQE